MTKVELLDILAELEKKVANEPETHWKLKLYGAVDDRLLTIATLGSQAVTSKELTPEQKQQYLNLLGTVASQVEQTPEQPAAAQTCPAIPEKPETKQAQSLDALVIPQPLDDAEELRIKKHLAKLMNLPVKSKEVQAALDAMSAAEKRKLADTIK